MVTRFISIYILGILLFSSAAIAAQSSKTAKKTADIDVFDELSKNNEGQGKVYVKQDSRMTVLLDKKIAENEDKSNIYYTGYRVQVFMGNNQKKSKAEALSRESKLKEKFPDLSTYLFFSSPFWKLRVGDFRTHTDALVFSKALLSEFPEMNGEIYIVKDDEVRDIQLEEERK